MEGKEIVINTLNLAPQLIALAKQNLHHRIFHPVPHLLALSDKDGNDLFESFLSYATKQLSMNWTLHIHLLNWLFEEEKWRPLINKDIIKSCLIASVTRWSMMGCEHVTAKGMMVCSLYLPHQAIGIWKSEAPDQPSKVVTIHLPTNAHPLQKNRYAISYEAGNWKQVEWMALPR